MATIALDMMGGDLGVSATVPGALMAARSGVRVVLVGQESSLEASVRAPVDAAGIDVVDAPDVIGMGEQGTARARGRARTSAQVGSELVRDGVADAIVSMGNTGAVMTTALKTLGRLPGVERPALALRLPAGREGTLLLDAGANADARPSHLLQFARLGSTFMHAAYGVERPRVALLSIGEEPSKGSSLVVEAHQMLEAESRVHFIGNVESRDLLTGQADVVVTDGFTGNVMVKMIEGLVPLVLGQIREAGRSSPRARLGSAFIGASLRGIGGQLSARHHGAAPLLGVNGGVFVGHGRSDAETIATAIIAADRAIDGGMLGAFAAELPARGAGD